MRYERRIYRLAKTIAKNEGDAEEVTQEAFVKAFDHIESFKGESRFHTWLVRITVNEALMRLRKRRAGRVLLDNPIATENGYVPREIEDWAPTPEERYSQNELADILSGRFQSFILDCGSSFSCAMLKACRLKKPPVC